MNDLKLAIYEAYANDGISEEQCDAMIESLENNLDDNILDDNILVESVLDSYDCGEITYEDAYEIFSIMDELMTEAYDDEDMYEFTLDVIDFLEASKYSSLDF